LHPEDKWHRYVGGTAEAESTTRDRITVKLRNNKQKCPHVIIMSAADL
jgi:hypothetical protein